MGNPAGVRRTQKLKRFRKEMERLAKKQQTAAKNDAAKNDASKKDPPAK
jgi:hypothetical protein